jgi:hypothetical protein
LLNAVLLDPCILVRRDDLGSRPCAKHCGIELDTGATRANSKVADFLFYGICGGTFVGWEWVTEDVVWAKLATLRAGADIASKRLWGTKPA